MRHLRIAIRIFPLIIVSLIVVVAILALFTKIERTVEARGEVRIHDYEVIRPLVEGIVQEVLVETGDLVSPGQVLARLEEPGLQSDLESVTQRLSEVRRDLAKRQAELTSNRELVHPLERAQQHDKMAEAELDAELLASRRKEAELTLETAHRRREQNLELERHGLISRLELREVEQEVLATVERLTQRRIEERLAHHRMPTMQRALQLLKATQSRIESELELEIRQLGEDLDLLQRELARLQVIERRHTLHASLDGIVLGALNNELLNRHVTAGEDLFQIIDVSSIHFVSRVPEEAMVQVRSGQNAAVEFIGLPKSRYQTFAGQVRKVDQRPIINVEGRPVYQVEIRLERPWIALADGPFFLRGGMRGTARIAYRRNVPIFTALFEFLAGTPQVPEPGDREPPSREAEAATLARRP